MVGKRGGARGRAVLREFLLATNLQVLVRAELLAVDHALDVLIGGPVRVVVVIVLVRA